MRLAVLMPSQTAAPGGVQRFAAQLVPALDEHGAEVFQYRSLAALSGWQRIVSDHRRVVFDALLSTFHWPPRLSSLPTFGVIHDLRTCPRSFLAPSRVVRSAIAASWSTTFVPSSHVADSVNAVLGCHRAVAIGEGLDHLDRYQAGPPPRRSDIVVIAGRAPHKRGRLALDAATVASDALRIPITVLGAVDGGIPTNASILSRPDDATLARAYQSALVAVAASSYEGFGLAAGEALRAGTPVVYACDGTLAELVGSGGLGAQPTVAALSEAIVQAVSRSDELGRAARAAAAPYTWSVTAERVLRIIGARCVRTSSGAAEVTTPANDPSDTR
jgi:Glycosyl transferases group 1